MSNFCFGYDFQKWIIISFASVAISLSVGLVLQYAYGQGFDISELQTMSGYCFLHADSDNPINDLVKQGLVDPYWTNWKCGDVNDLLQRELQKQARNEEYAAQEKLDIMRNCTYGNLTPSEVSQCIDADITTNGPTCLFSEDEEDWSLWYTTDTWNSGYQKLTPEEISECQSKGYCGDGSVIYHGCKDDKKEDKDNKD